MAGIELRSPSFGDHQPIPPGPPCQRPRQPVPGACVVRGAAAGRGTGRALPGPRCPPRHLHPLGPRRPGADRDRPGWRRAAGRSRRGPQRLRRARLQRPPAAGRW